MILYALSAFVNGLLGTVFGIFVFFRKPKSRISQTFALLTLSVAIWSFSYWQWQLSLEYSRALFWAYLLTVGSSFIPITYLHWVLAVLHKKKKNKILLFGYILSFFISIFSFTSLMIKDVKPIMDFPWWPEAGILYTIYILLYVCTAGYATFELLSSYKKGSGTLKLQLKYVILGSVVGFIGGLTNFPLWYGIKIPPVGNFLVAFYPIFFTYAIVKHRFLDIRLAVRAILVRMAAVLLIVGLSLFIYYLFNEFVEGLHSKNVSVLILIISIFSASFYKPSLSFVRKVTDRLFFQREYSHEELLKTLGKTIIETLDLDVLIGRIRDDLLKVMRMKYVLFVLITKADESYQKNIVYSFGIRKQGNYFGEKNILIEAILQKPEVLIRDELKYRSEELEGSKKAELENIVCEMDKIEAQALIPLVSSKGIEGVMVLGEKVSGEAYTLSEIQTLETLAYQAGTAIENARLYSEVKTFSQKLQKEVEKATRDLKDSNKKLLKVNERLRELDHLKDAFVPIASQELKTPLTAIKNYLWMLKEGKEFRGLDKKQKQHIDQIAESAEKLMDSVKELDKGIKEKAAETNPQSSVSQTR